MTGRKILGMIAAATLALTACGGDSDNPGQQPGAADFNGTPSGSLKTLGFNPSDEVGTARADHAKKQLSGVTIDMDTANFDAQKFATLAAAGTLPDVVQMDRQDVASFAQQGLLMPLDDCFGAQQVKPREYWYPDIIDETSHESRIYGAPQFFQPSIIMVNTRAAEGVAAADFDTSKPDDLVKLAGKLTQRKGAQPARLGFDPDIPGSVRMWLEVFGGKVKDAEGKPTLDDAANLKAFEFLDELMKAQGGYEEVTSFKQTWDVFGVKNQFATDQLVAGLWAQWYINVLSDSKDAVQLDAVPLKDKDGKVFGLAGGTALTIPAKAKNPVAACTWITSVTSLEAWQAAGAARAATVKEKNSINTGLFTGSPTADKAVREAHVVPSGNASFDKLIKTTYDVLADTRTLGASPVGKVIDEALQQAVGAALGGEKSAEQALKDAQTQAMTAWDGLGPK